MHCYFVNQVRAYEKKGYTLSDAIEAAMRLCIEENILKDFLERNGSEVVNMLYTEFDLEEALRVREEEGEKRGEKRTSQKIAISLLDILDEETIAKKTGLTLEEIEELKKNGFQG